MWAELRPIIGWPSALATKQTSGKRSNLWSRKLSPIVWQLWLSKLNCREHPSDWAVLQGFHLPFWERIFSIALLCLKERPACGLSRSLCSIRALRLQFLSHATYPLKKVKAMPPWRQSWRFLGGESQIWHLGSTKNDFKLSTAKPGHTCISQTVWARTGRFGNIWSRIYVLSCFDCFKRHSIKESLFVLL